MRQILWIAVPIIAGIGGCGSSVAPTAPDARVSFDVHTSPHLVFRYTALDAATIAATADTLEEHYTRVTADLEVDDRSPIHITLHPDRASLREAVAPLVGAIPDFASGLVTDADDIHIVSPAQTAAWPYQIGLTNIVHELAHCVSLRINPSFANRPRWLWESVALYEAGQVGDQRTIQTLLTGRIVTLAELNALENTLIYDVGFLLGEFITVEWGRERLVALIRSNGNTQETLGLSEVEFLSRWTASLESARFAG